MEEENKEQQNKAADSTADPVAAAPAPTPPVASPPAANPAVAPAQPVAQQKSSNHTWIVCLILGCFGIVVIIPILIIIAIVAINPAARVKQATESLANSDVQSVSKAVSACIAEQKTKGASPAVIFSKTEYDVTSAQGGCAAESTLTGGSYIQTLPTDVTLLAGADKVCAYAQVAAQTEYASWDSKSDQLLTAPNGKTTCT